MNIRLLSGPGLASVLAVSGCYYYDCGWQEPVTLDLGTNADLHDVARFLVSETYESGNLIVGSDGAVIVLHSYESAPFVEQMKVGDADLRAVWTGLDAGSWSSQSDPLWWVVGDAGTAAFSENYGATWTTVDVGTTATLSDVTSGDTTMVVGDEFVGVQHFLDGPWQAIPVPPGGWGSLRSVYDNGGEHVFVVGLGGVIWSTDTISVDGEWTRETSGVEEDLFYVGPWGPAAEAAAFGADGTFLVREDGEWLRIDTHVTTDLIDQEGDMVLGADGRVFRVFNREFSRIDSLGPGMRALGDRLIVVGDGGWALWTFDRSCAE